MGMVVSAAISGIPMIDALDPGVEPGTKPPQKLEQNPVKLPDTKKNPKDSVPVKAAAKKDSGTKTVTVKVKPEVSSAAEPKKSGKNPAGKSGPKSAGPAKGKSANAAAAKGKKK